MLTCGTICAQACDSSEGLEMLLALASVAGYRRQFNHAFEEIFLRKFGGVVCYAKEAWVAIRAFASRIIFGWTARSDP